MRDFKEHIEAYAEQRSKKHSLESDCVRERCDVSETELNESLEAVPYGNHGYLSSIQVDISYLQFNSNSIAESITVTTVVSFVELLGRAWHWQRQTASGSLQLFQVVALVVSVDKPMRDEKKQIRIRA